MDKDIEDTLGCVRRRWILDSPLLLLTFMTWRRKFPTLAGQREKIVTSDNYT
jgi:hypothetical protein